MTYVRKLKLKDQSSRYRAVPSVAGSAPPDTGQITSSRISSNTYIPASSFRGSVSPDTEQLSSYRTSSIGYRTASRAAGRTPPDPEHLFSSYRVILKHFLHRQDQLHQILYRITPPAPPITYITTSHPMQYQLEYRTASPAARLAPPCEEHLLQL